MDYYKQWKLAEKLFKDILKHGDKNVDKFFNKGVTPEKLLTVWERASTEEKDAFGNERLYSLLLKADIHSAIKNEEKYPYQILSRFVNEKSVQDIVKLANDLKIKNFMLEVVTGEFSHVSDGVGHNLDIGNKYAQAIKVLTKDMNKVDISALDNITAFASGIPFGKQDYQNRKQLMDLARELCKLLSEKLIPTQIKGAGCLKRLYSPIVEDDQMSIEFIGDIAKILMDAGFDLYAEDFTMEDSICRKDTTGKLQKELENYYYDKQKSLGV